MLAIPFCFKTQLNIILKLIFKVVIMKTNNLFYSIFIYSYCKENYIVIY